MLGATKIISVHLIKHVFIIYSQRIVRSFYTAVCLVFRVTRPELSCLPEGKR